jgi:hypothetical protein
MDNAVRRPDVNWRGMWGYGIPRPLWATHGMGDAVRCPNVNRHGMWGHGM